LRDLVYRNAAVVESGRDFNVHIDRLISSISRLVEKPSVREHRNEEPAATAVQNSLASPLRRDGPNVAIAAASRDTNLERRSSSQSPHSFGDQPEGITGSSDQLLTIRSARQGPLWTVAAVAGAVCALIVSVWFAFRYELTGRADQVASEIAKRFPSEKIEINRQTDLSLPKPPT
jgi:hypothetical protein